MKPHVISETLCGLSLLRLRNDHIEVSLLPEKGCNILQICDSQGRKILAPSKDWRDQIDRYVKNGKKSLHYAEHYEGGWQDVFPGCHGILDQELHPGKSGEATTLPWIYELIPASSSPIPYWAPLVRAEVDLPDSGLHLEKRFFLTPDAGALRVETAIFNPTPHELNLNWNQHPAFGEDLLNGDWFVEIPHGTVVPSPFLQGKESSDSLQKIPITEYQVSSTGEGLHLHQHPYGDPDLFLCVKNIEQNWITIINSTTHLKMQLRWDLQTFPHLWYWTANREQIKTVAFEPSSTWLPDYPDSYSQGLTHTLSPQGTLSSWIEISLETL